MRKFLCFILVSILSLSAFSCKEEKVKADTSVDVKKEKSIDIYLIAGQSNAGGHSKVVDEAALFDKMPQLEEGVGNVFYAGSYKSSSGDPRNHNWQTVRIGFGFSDKCFGPEIGMAKVLGDYYSDRGSDVGFIKFARGGTNLLNVKSGTNGNWTSPSYAEYLGVSYNEDDLTGKLYRGLLDQIRTRLAELKEFGEYTKINVKGIYWMQGESDRSNPKEYAIAFKYFTEDIRRDLSAIMKEFTESDDDCGASNLPVLIGTISSGFAIETAYTQTKINDVFISMQKKLADEIDNCYVVDNSSYMITEYVSNEIVIRGVDMWHWNQDQMLTIGENVGGTIIEEILSKEDHSEDVGSSNDTASSNDSDSKLLKWCIFTVEMIAALCIAAGTGVFLGKKKLKGNK